MARFKRKEIEKAFDKFQAAALKGAQTSDWSDWSNCFTEDATYFEHNYGRYWGRQRIHDWITDTMNHYAGNGMFKYEEDAYNPQNMGVMIGKWLAAREKIEDQAADTTEA